MRIVTWNVNSIRIRQDRLLAFLERHKPDVVCLQELKVEADKYPHELLESLGWHSAINAQKTYNGVAILSRSTPSQVTVGLGDGVEDPQARLVAATIDGVRVVCVYMPNGSTVGSDKWVYKLEWMRRLRRWLDQHATPDTPLALCGDFNVAPEPIDVHEPAAWEDETIYHPEARAGLAHIAQFGLVDTFRQQHPNEPGFYSWWDYRMLGFPKNRGLRIDHIFATEPLAAKCTHAFIDREERKGQQPSDHAPVIVDFQLGS